MPWLMVPGYAINEKTFYCLFFDVEEAISAIGTLKQHGWHKPDKKETTYIYPEEVQS